MPNSLTRRELMKVTAGWAGGLTLARTDRFARLLAADDNERRPLFAGEGDQTVRRVAGLDRRSWTAVGRDAVDGFSQQSGGGGNLFFASAWLHDMDE